MAAEIYQISFERFDAMIGDFPEKPVVLSAAKLASDILVGMYNDEPLVYIGLVPPHIFSDVAYVWMMTTPAGDAHPILLARYGAKTLETILLKYHTLHGHCFSEKSARWLKRLGAEFTSETKFEIRRG